MAERKLNHIKSLFWLLGIAVIISACGNGAINIPYTFVNQSDYTVYITLSKEYFTRDSEGTLVASGSNTLTVSGNSEIKIDIYSKAVDFSWTTYYENDNSSVYCEVSQNKATFKNRFKQ